jgi:HPt (histidine-containing phosphotransfer) domain-containing protein
MNIPTSTERLNIADVRRRLGGNDALITDLLRMFLDSVPGHVAAVKAAVETRHLDAVRRSAHAFKGCAGNLSATGVVQASAAIEAAAERGDAAPLDRLLAVLMQEVDGLVAELEGR